METVVANEPHRFAIFTYLAANEIGRGMSCQCQVVIKLVELHVLLHVLQKVGGVGGGARPGHELVAVQLDDLVVVVLEHQDGARRRRVRRDDGKPIVKEER